MIDRIQLIRNIGQIRLRLCRRSDPIDETHANLCRKRAGIPPSRLFCDLSSGDPVPINERRRLASANLPELVISLSGSTPIVFQNRTWSKYLNDVTVFDDLFVAENVYSSLVVDAEQLDETIIPFRTKNEPIVVPAGRSGVSKMLVAGAVEVDTARRDAPA